MKKLQLILIQFLLIYENFSLTNGFCWQLIRARCACSNFYEYACKDYSRLNPTSNYSEITQKLEYKMNALLLQRMDYLDRTHKLDNERIFVYRKSCLNVKRRDIRKYLEEIKPTEQLNWPLLQTKDEGFEQEGEWFDVWSLLGRLQSYGLNNVILTHDVTRNENNTLNIYLKPALRDTDETLKSQEIFKVLLNNLAVENITTKILELQNTENEWLEMLQDYAEANFIQELSLKDLNIIYPKLNLTTYLKELLGNKELDKITLITLENPQYFEALNNRTWSGNELEKLCNYLMIKFLYYVTQQSAPEFTDVGCLKDLKNKFEMALNLFYYNHFFQHWGEKYVEPLEEMLEHIKQTMMLYFAENHLKLSDAQLQYLKAKLRAIKINIGNLPYNFNNETIEEFYQDLNELNNENYYKNQLLVLKHNFRKSLLYQGNLTYFPISTQSLASISSPFYLPHKNMIVIPYATLELSFFNYSGSALQQLSQLGFVLAHELAHAFDTTGLQYDAYGTPLLKPSGILENVNFMKSLECMQEQHATQDIDERIADLFASHVVYRTYNDFYKKNSTNWEKDFFLSLAQFFCGKQDIRFIDHDADPIRLQQIVKNSSPFSQAFECRKGSSMNPRTKCRLY